MLKRIRSLRSEVILWSDLNDIGSPRQISRVLKECLEDGVLVRIGRGIYAKATQSKYIDVPIIRKDFETICLEALKRLDVEWELGQNIKDYNEGRTQQVPAQFEVRLKKRFRRTLALGNSKLRFEGKINAK